MRNGRTIAALAIYATCLLSATAQQHRAYISRADLPTDPGGQQTPAWCWAASIGYIFAYYKHPVSQCQIVRAFYGGCPVVPGNPKTMGTAFSTTWTDSSGQAFRVRASITDDYWNTSREVDNQDVVNALINDVPVFYATATHAMVLISVTYYTTPSGPVIVEGQVWDPNPEYHHGGQNGGIRTVRGEELKAHYVAIPEIDKGDTQNAGPVDEPAKIVPQSEGTFCPRLRKIIDSASNNFTQIETGPFDNGHASVNLSLPDAKQCRVLDLGYNGKFNYQCTYTPDKYDQLIREMERCLTPAIGYFKGAIGDYGTGKDNDPSVKLYTGDNQLEFYVRNRD